MILSMPKELEDFLTRCQKITNDRFWFCNSFEFRYQIINPCDDNAQVMMLVGVDGRVMQITFYMQKICSDLNGCITYFEDALKQYEDFLVYAIIKDNYG